MRAPLTCRERVVGELPKAEVLRMLAGGGVGVVAPPPPTLIGEPIIMIVWPVPLMPIPKLPALLPPRPLPLAPLALDAAGEGTINCAPCEGWRPTLLALKEAIAAAGVKGSARAIASSSAAGLEKPAMLAAPIVVEKANEEVSAVSIAALSAPAPCDTTEEARECRRLRGDSVSLRSIHFRT